MIVFDPHNRVKEIENNLYCISIGAQTNCAGIACILASISQCKNCTVHDIDVDSMGHTSDKSTFYGTDIPEPIKEAVFSGVSEELENSHISKLVTFRLIGVLYHPVDSNINMHKIAGKALVKKWNEGHA